MKYLEEIGVKLPDPVVNSIIFSEEDNQERDARFKSQRSIYGFDERETWDLRYSSACWLYQHLKLYKDLGGQVIDLSFYKFRLEDMNEELSQGDVIDIIIELLENFLKYENRSGIQESFNDDEEEVVQSNLRKAFKMYGEIVSAMWW